MTENIIISAAANTNIPSWFVVCMGLGTVFVGLICIILICKVMSLFCHSRKPEKVQKTVEKTPAAPIENRQEIIAAVCAAVAEDLGTDISALRVVSFKKI